MQTVSSTNPTLAAEVARRRTFAIISHPDAGKTTLTEKLLLYAGAIEDYNPAPHLAKITAPLLAINSADDFVNPPELPMMQDLIKQVKQGRFILLPISDETRGHGTHSIPAIWGGELVKFMAELK